MANFLNQVQALRKHTFFEDLPMHQETQTATMQHLLGTLYFVGFACVPPELLFEKYAEDHFKTISHDYSVCGP
jgi:hypothetical protein